MKINSNIFDVLNLKTELLIEDKKELLEYYDDKDRYEKFLYSTFALLKLEPNFFLLEQNLQKTQIVISYLRNLGKDNNDLINTLIGELNKLDLIKNKKEIVDKYYVEERNLRGCLFNTKSELLNSILHDSIFIEDVRTSYFGVDMFYFLATTSYFNNKYPVIYDNKQVLEATSTILKTIKHTNSFKTNLLVRKLKKELNI